MGNQNLLKRLKQYRILYLMLLPGVIAIFIFNYIPMYGVLLAFKEYMFREGILGSPWVKFAHFERIFSDPYFYKVLRNTLIISSYRLFWGFTTPIVFALLLNEIRHKRFKKIVQTSSYLPHFMSWVILGGILFSILSLSGPINGIREFLGLEPKIFLTDSSSFRTLLIISGIWKEVGWGTIIYLATISGIDPSLYEAATIDGAGRFQKVRYITLPSLKSTMVILLILSTASILNAGFDQIFNLYNTLVYEVADIIDTYVYRLGLVNMEYGYSTAIGLFKSLVGMVLILTSNTVVNKIGGKGYGLW